MITEQDLKQKCTPEIIKKMVKLAEGFEVTERQITVGNQLLISRGIKYNINSCETTKDFSEVMVKFSLFPLLLHRAVEGWNHDENTPYYIQICPHRISYVGIMYLFKDYHSRHLTACEMAIWDCLLEVLK